MARPDDVEDLARAIVEAISLSRSACRARAEAACDMGRMVDAYEQLYVELVEMHHASAVRANDAVEDRLIA